MTAVFFDIDGTLLDHERAQRIAALAFLHDYGAELPYSGNDFLALWISAAERYVQAYMDGRLSFRDQRRGRICEVFGRQMPDAEADRLFDRYLAHYEAEWRLFADVLPCLDRLAGYTLGIITNGDAEHQRNKLLAMGILGRFADVVVSEAVGLAKPDARIFALACQRLNQDPANCIHVGDLFDADARGARAAGLAGVWLDRTRNTTAALEVPVIHSLDEFPDLVRTWLAGRWRPAL